MLPYVCIFLFIRDENSGSSGRQGERCVAANTASNKIRLVGLHTFYMVIVYLKRNLKILDLAEILWYLYDSIFSVESVPQLQCFTAYEISPGFV